MTETKQKIEPQPSNWFRKIVTGGSQVSSVRRYWRLLVCAAVAGAAISSAHAVILSYTNDPNYNTTAPTGTLAGSGWELQGSWGEWLGTPIAPRYFLSSKHIPRKTGDVFRVNGVEFHTVAYQESSNSDLCIWKVAETFAAYAPLYTNNNEVGRSLVVFGRGTQRGEDVTLGEEFKGWKWGAVDYRQRCGENVVSSVVNNGGVTGALFKMEFNRNSSLTNEAHLSAWDSGGAVFIQEN